GSRERGGGGDGADPPLMKATTGSASCCARAASGHAAAPPSSVMNARRFTRSPRRRGRALLAVCRDQMSGLPPKADIERCLLSANRRSRIRARGRGFCSLEQPPKFFARLARGFRARRIARRELVAPVIGSAGIDHGD